MRSTTIVAVSVFIALMGIAIMSSAQSLTTAPKRVIVAPPPNMTRTAPTATTQRAAAASDLWGKIFKDINTNQENGTIVLRPAPEAFVTTPQAQLLPPTCRKDFYFRNVSSGSKDAAACMAEPIEGGGTNSNGYLCEFDKGAFDQWVKANNGCSTTEGFQHLALAARERAYVCANTNAQSLPAAPTCAQSYAPMSVQETLDKNLVPSSFITMATALKDKIYFCVRQTPLARVCGPVARQKNETHSQASATYYYDVDNCGADHFCCGFSSFAQPLPTQSTAPLAQ